MKRATSCRLRTSLRKVDFEFPCSITVTGNPGDRGLSSTVEPSTMNVASSSVWVPGVIAGSLALQANVPFEELLAQVVASSERTPST